MASMTPRTKIAVSLPTELVDAARDAANRGRTPSVSAYVAEALKERVKLDELDRLLQELLARSGGPLTDAERSRIDGEAGWR